MITNEEIYKVGDRVYDYINMYGWGSVSKIVNSVFHPLVVKFDTGSKVSYTGNGQMFGSQKFPTLSFTEYDLVNGGFSQVRPQPEIAVDTPIFVRWSEEQLWNIRYFSHFDKKGNAVCFRGQLKSIETTVTNTWYEYSLENPLL